MSTSLPPAKADSSVLEVLEKYWGYDSFLPLQEPATRSVIAQQDSVVVLPTGGGKSICFQAPALCMPGLAIVVSPLIALMKDQVDSLQASGVPAACIHSMISISEREEIADQIRDGLLKLLYVSPERLVQERTLQFLKQQQLSLIAIDEAHCISAWGHDFRPEYRRLSVLRETFPGVGIHAYTATATEQVRGDIVRQLSLTNPEILVGSFDRPNLVYRVQRSHNRLQQIRKTLDQHAGESGIIYCITRREVESTCAALQTAGYKVLPYHAGMEDNDRRKNQDEFIHEKADTIVATVAFGMGIDKSNVRYVIHSGMPKSLEHYQQESGRAGRDGLEAECFLLYSGQDFMTWRSLLDDDETPQEAKQGMLQSLQSMANYCASVSCRHQTIVEHFGQTQLTVPCNACDVCLGELDLVEDPLIVGQKVLSCVIRTQQRFGANHTADVLIGSQNERVTQLGHDQLSTWGILSDDSKRAVRDWIEQLVEQGFLQKVGEYNILEVTEKGRCLLRGEETPRLLKPARPKQPERPKPSVDTDSWEGVDRGLFAALRGLRRDLASQRNVPAYIVFGDAALRDMARRRPTDQSSFRHVRGVGEKKLRDFGEQFVTFIADYCRKHDLPSDVTAALRQPPATEDAELGELGPSQAALSAFQQFRSGRSVAQVADDLQRSPATVQGYLVQYIQQERISDPGKWVDAAVVAEVTAAVEEFGRERLKPIFDALGGTIGYDEIRIVVACLEHAD